MSVVERAELDRRMDLGVDHPQSIVITPLLEKHKKAKDRDAIDVRLGSYFLLPQVPPEPFIVPSKSFAGRAHFRIHVPLGSFLVLPAHHTVLGATLEFIKLPNDLSGQILTKSSIARTFIIIETAPWIHPLYRGCLTLEIANVSNTPILLYPGRPIGQLVFLEISKRSSARRKTEPAKLSGSYLGPVYPGPPNLPDPADDLRDIGVPESEIKLPVTFEFSSLRMNSLRTIPETQIKRSVRASRTVSKTIQKQSSGGTHRRSGPHPSR
jgi:dCTP deaminase